MIAHFSLIYSYFPTAGKELKHLVGEYIRGMHSLGLTKEHLRVSICPPGFFSHNVHEILLHTMQS